MASGRNIAQGGIFSSIQFEYFRIEIAFDYHIFRRAGTHPAGNCTGHCSAYSNSSGFS